MRGDAMSSNDDGDRALANEVAEAEEEENRRADRRLTERWRRFIQQVRDLGEGDRS